MLRHTPSILQMEAVECGAASLAMILAHHGRWEPLEKLRVACGVSRDGSKASNLLKAARQYGLQAKGFRKQPDALDSLPVPSIIHWNFNHYLVYEGRKGKYAYINDPANGPRRITPEELDESFTGVVLAFEKGDGFEKGGRPPSLWGELAARLKYSWGGLFFIAMLSVLLIVPGIVMPVFAKVFVDDVLVAQMRSWVMPLLLGLGLTAVARGLLTAMQQQYLLKLETKLSVTMASRYFHRLLTLPMSFFNQRHPGDLASRVASSDQVAKLLSGQLATSLFDLVSLLFFAAVMAAYSVKLAIIGVGLALLNVIALRLVRKRRDNLNRNLLNEAGKLQATTVNVIGAIESVKADGTEDDAFGRWAGYQATSLRATQELGLIATIMAAVPVIAMGLSSTAILVIGGMEVIDGALTIGGLVALQSLMASLRGPIDTLLGLAGDLQMAAGDVARLGDVFRYETGAQAENSETEAGGALNGELSLQGIDFGYNPMDAPLIEGFDLNLQAGARVALVGGSGSGKSTIGRLICGLAEPWRGSVRIDGIPIAEIPRQRFANAVAYVDQDVFLFEGSVRDNLSLWDPTVPEDAITQALKDAEIHAEIAARPGHYDTRVDEGGNNFSGGQRQRLEIARALINDPAIVVLDEATAALDPVTEKSIDDNLRRRGCASVIIAHRLSTIRDCDEIIVLRHGRVVERGSHDELMERGGEYAGLIAAA